MRPTEAAKVSTEMKSKPARTGRCQAKDMTTALARTMRLRSSETATADANADSSHTAGEQGFVKTILRLRLRRCEETTKRPRPAAKKSRNPFMVEYISCNELKFWTPQF